jgi:hypothetical protein
MIVLLVPIKICLKKGWVNSENLKKFVSEIDGRHKLVFPVSCSGKHEKREQQKDSIRIWNKIYSCKKLQEYASENY